MKVTIESGQLTINKRSVYGKWLLGYKDGGGWTGIHTLDKAWERALKIMPATGCSWYALGKIMASSDMLGVVYGNED